MKVICNRAKTCKFKNCGGKKPHSPTEFYRGGGLCSSESRKCSFSELLVRCVSVKIKGSK